MYILYIYTNALYMVYRHIMVKVSAFDSIDYLHPPKLCAEGTHFSNSLPNREG